MPAADAVAVDHGHHRLGDVANHAMEFPHMQSRHAALVVVPTLTADLLIAARAKIPLRPAQHHHPDGIIAPGVVKCREHLIDGKGSEGIEHLRTVDDHPGDAVRFLSENILKLTSHGRSP
jgi:hypothetical protein